jgi:hypothetical protein
MVVLEADAEHRVGQQLDHLPTHFEKLFLGHSHPAGKKDAPP